jgi:hypothetical protein
MDFSNARVLTFEQGCQYLGYAKSYVYKLQVQAYCHTVNQTAKASFLTVNF